MAPATSSTDVNDLGRSSDDRRPQRTTTLYAPQYATNSRVSTNDGDTGGQDELVDSDSGESTASASSRGSRRKRTRYLKSKSSRSSKPRTSSTHTSSLSSNGDSFLPTLGRILEGKSPSKNGSNRINFSSTRNQGRSKSHHRHTGARSGRAARPNYSSQALSQNRIKHLMSPSMQSVATSLTTATSSSSGSNGSNSTITQKSFTRSEPPVDDTWTSENEPRSSRPSRHRRRRHRKDSDEPNVFAFMENPYGSCKDGKHELVTVHTADKAPSPPSPPAMKFAHRSSADQLASPRPMRVASWNSQEQLHSDSGISVRSSSPESSGRPTSWKQGPLSGQEDVTKSKTDETSASAQDHIDATASWQRRFSNSGNFSAGSQYPPGYPSRQATFPSLSMIPHGPSRSSQDLYPYLTTTHTQRRDGSLKPSGYDVLASRLAEYKNGVSGSVKPLYRKFSRLNHRILLHLQDEIAEMEEHLEYLDSRIAIHKPPSSPPESRRVDARHPNELTYRRTELLGCIYIKIKQYNDALSSFDQVTGYAQQPQAEEIERYRQFTKDSTPIVEEELRFLQHPNDLLSLSAKEAHATVTSSQPRPITAVPALLLGPPAAMLVAFVMFSAASNGLVRVFLFLLFSAASFAAVRFGALGEGMMTDQEKHMCLGFYASLLACIAATAG